MAVVNRAKKVKVMALDKDGKKISYIAENWHARIIQHEIDHLNGVLYIDKMKTKSFITVKNFNMLWRKALPEKINRSFG
jgi:peptide deformylase